MLDEAVKLLKELGFDVTYDDSLLQFIGRSVMEQVKNEINHDDIPDGLRYLVAEMIVGRYLSAKKSAGQLEGFDADAVVKQLQEGDTSISFAIGEGSLTPEQRLDMLIAHLSDGRRGEILRYRRLLW